MTLKQTLEMIYAFKGRITNKQGSGMCGDAPLSMNFVYGIECCLFDLFMYSLIVYLFGYRE